MSTSAMQQFYDAIPSNVKTITWVLTASEGGVNNSSINATIKNFVNSHDNMRYLDWKTYVDNNGGWSSYQGGDNIHMSASGYERYVNFQTQGLYDLYGSGDKSASGVASGGGDFLEKLYGVAQNTVSTAIDRHVQAEEDKKNNKAGCNFTTSKVSDGSNKSDKGTSTIGGNLQPDGTGSVGSLSGSFTPSRSVLSMVQLGRKLLQHLTLVVGLISLVYHGLVSVQSFLQLYYISFGRKVVNISQMHKVMETRLQEL